MDAARFLKVKAFCLILTDLALSERTEFLEILLPDDPELRDLVLEILESEDTAGRVDQLAAQLERILQRNNN